MLSIFFFFLQGPTEDGFELRAQCETTAHCGRGGVKLAAGGRERRNNRPLEPNFQAHHHPTEHHHPPTVCNDDNDNEDKDDDDNDKDNGLVLILAGALFYGTVTFRKFTSV